MMERESQLVVTAKVIADRRYGPGGAEVRTGTKHFRPGAKVYVIDGHRGTCDTVTVVGHHRASGRYAKLDMPVKHLEDFRLGRTHSPTVIALIKERYSGRNAYSDETARELCRILPIWKAQA